ncbi:MAG TPA: hypothetical protein PKB04_05205 [Phenylobacterium sp.]|nr:hypothetical protein [Phenylobacterium sp.]HMP63824.1 hypothetical protein [Phenylobacterium sp.]
MTRFIESRSFWFRLICILCLGFGVFVQALDHLNEDRSHGRSLAPITAHAPGETTTHLPQE